MDYNIRNQVIANLQNADANTVLSTIEDAINSQTETVLPGLGVMLELAWKKAPDNVRNHIINSIHDGIKK